MKEKKSADEVTAKTGVQNKPSKVKKVETDKPTVELAPEQKVVLISSMNDTAIEAIKKKVAEKMGLEIVVINSETAADYILSRKQNVANPEITFETFITNTKNRDNAIENALQLYGILTKETIDKSKDLVFSTSMVTQKTTLTHSSLQNLLGVLSAFGLVEFVKGSHLFKLVFDDETKERVISREVNNSIEVLRQQLIKYKVLVSKDFANEKFAQAVETLKKAVE